MTKGLVLPEMKLCRMEWFLERNIFRFVGGATYEGWKANEHLIRGVNGTAGDYAVHVADLGDDETEGEGEGVEDEEDEEVEREEVEEVESVMTPTRRKRARSTGNNDPDEPLSRRRTRTISPERQDAINTLWAMHLADTNQTPPAYSPIPRPQSTIAPHHKTLLAEHARLFASSSETISDSIPSIITPESQPAPVVSANPEPASYLSVTTTTTTTTPPARLLPSSISGKSM